MVISGLIAKIKLALLLVAVSLHSGRTGGVAGRDRSGAHIVHASKHADELGFSERWCTRLLCLEMDSRELSSAKVARYLDVYTAVRAERSRVRARMRSQSMPPSPVCSCRARAVSRFLARRGRAQCSRLSFVELDGAHVCLYERSRRGSQSPVCVSGGTRGGPTGGVPGGSRGCAIGERRFALAMR